MKEERGKKKNPRGEDRTQWKKKGKKKKKKETQEEMTEPSERRKEKKKSKGKVELWLVGPPCVFNYKNVFELWVMETENS